MSRNLAVCPYEPAWFAPGPPRSGQLTPYAAKVGAQCLILVMSIVVAINVPASVSPQNGVSWAATGLAIVSALLIAIVITFNLSRDLTGNALPNEGWFGRKVEVWIMVLFVGIFWIPTVGMVCSATVTNKGVSGIAQVAAWTAMIACIYAGYKAYHSRWEDEASTEIHYYDLRVGAQSGAEVDEAQYR